MTIDALNGAAADGGWLTTEYRRRLEKGDPSVVLSLPANTLALT